MFGTLKTAFAGALMALFVGHASAQDIETNKLSIGMGVDLPFLVHVVAHEKGWLKDAGFTDVSFKTFQSGNLAGEALLAGEIQLWTPGNLPPIAMAHNGLPVVILGSNAVSHGLEKVVVRKDAGIDKPEDLYNVKLGLFVSSTSGALMGNLAKYYGLDASKLQLVNLAPSEAMAAMANDEIQGIVFWEPWPYLALQQQDTKVVHTGTVSGFETNKGEFAQISNNRTVWVASQDWVRANPKAANALVDVLVKTQKYISDPANSDEVIKMFSMFQDQPVEMNKALLSNYVFDADVDKTYVEDMNAVTAFLEATNRIQSAKNPLDYTYTAPLAAADPSLVKIEGNWKP